MGWQVTRLDRQLIPSPCCILDQTAYPWAISPEDSHCVFVPTKYNSHWMQVISRTRRKQLIFLQGCLPRPTEYLTANTSTVILVIIFLLTVEMTVILLAVCLCVLQNSRTHKHTVV